MDPLQAASKQIDETQKTLNEIRALNQQIDGFLSGAPPVIAQDQAQVSPETNKLAAPAQRMGESRELQNPNLLGEDDHLAELERERQRIAELELALLLSRHPEIVLAGDSFASPDPTPRLTADLYIALPAGSDLDTAIYVNGVEIQTTRGSIQHLQLEFRSSPAYCTVKLQRGSDQDRREVTRRFVADHGRSYLVDAAELSE